MFSRLDDDGRRGAPCLEVSFSPGGPNARGEPRQQPERGTSGATVLIVKGALVSFFSFGPPGVARASDASAEP